MKLQTARILLDNFSFALVIEQAVAVNWPDRHGSIGEYYAVSNHNYEKQKELTTHLNESIILGSDTEVFAAINIFMDLFTNGSYNIYMNDIDPQSSEICNNMQKPFCVLQHISPNMRHNLVFIISSLEQALTSLI